MHAARLAIVKISAFRGILAGRWIMGHLSFLSECSGSCGHPPLRVSRATAEESASLMIGRAGVPERHCLAAIRGETCPLRPIDRFLQASQGACGNGAEGSRPGRRSLAAGMPADEASRTTTRSRRQPRCYQRERRGSERANPSIASRFKQEGPQLTYRRGPRSLSAVLSRSPI